MDLTLLLSLIPLFFKYGPLAYTFIETQGPGVQAFVKEIEADLPKNADGSINWAGISVFSLLPIAFKYGPQAISFLQQQGVLFEHLIADVQTTLKGAPLAAPAPIVHALPSATITAPLIRGLSGAPGLTASAPVGGFNS